MAEETKDQLGFIKVLKVLKVMKVIKILKVSISKSFTWWVCPFVCLLKKVRTLCLIVCPFVYLHINVRPLLDQSLSICLFAEKCPNKRVSKVLTVKNSKFVRCKPTGMNPTVVVGLQLKRCKPATS